eukprot:scaffold25500_cov31-Attheya_sp.AAC.2
MRELHHEFSMQGNETMNNHVASFATNTKTYSTRMSLYNMVKMAGSIQIAWHFGFWIVFDELEIYMPIETELYHKVKQAIKESKKWWTEMKENKRKWQEKYFEKLKKRRASKREEKKLERMHLDQVSMTDPGGDNESQGGATAGGGTNKSQHSCIHCDEYDHKTSNSRKWEKNPDFNPKTAAKQCSDCQRRGHASP